MFYYLIYIILILTKDKGNIKMDIQEKKDILRKNCLKMRKKHNLKLISYKIVNNIKNIHYFKYAKNIMIYMPLKYEIDITSLLNISDKNFYLPKCVRDEIKVVKYEKNMQFIKSNFNVLEPVSKDYVDISILDIVFIPALCCDLNKYRLGYGCGFYDRFLKKLSKSTIKIIIASKEMCYLEIPVTNFDEKADFIINEENIL